MQRYYLLTALIIYVFLVQILFSPWPSFRVLEKKDRCYSGINICKRGNHIGQWREHLRPITELWDCKIEEYDFNLLTIGAGSGGLEASRSAGISGARVDICDLLFSTISSDIFGGSVVFALLVMASKTEEKVVTAENKVSIKVGGKKGKRKHNNSYIDFKMYCYKVLKQVHPDIGISSKGGGLMNQFINDIFEKIASEADNIARDNKRHIIDIEVIQTAMMLALPSELAKRANSEGTKALPLELAKHANSEGTKVVTEVPDL